MLKKIGYGLLAVLLLFVFLLATQYHADIPVETLKAKYAQAPSKFMAVDGMQVHYRDEGEGYPIVLIHGTSSSLHTWDGWVYFMAKKYHIIRMDLPAFGLTGPNANNDYSIETYSQFMEHFLQGMNIKECYMAGNSLGGNIAWYYAAAHPVQVRKLVLVDAGGYPMDKVPFAFKFARNPITSKLMRYITPRALFEKSIKDVYGNPAKVTDSIVTRYFELSLREGNRQALIARANQMGTVDNTKTIKMISIPTLIEWGENDKWIPVKNGNNFHRDIMGSDLVIYPHLGHIPMEEDPVSTSRDALNFFTNDTTGMNNNN